MIFFGNSYHPALKTPYLVKSLLTTPWSNIWTLFSILWWISWAPILAILIANSSSGYSWRAIIIATLIFPSIIAVGLSWPPLFHAIKTLDYSLPWLGVLLTCIGILLLFMIIARKEIFSSVMHTYLSKTYSVKYRSPDRFICHILQFATLMLCFYLSTGILLLNVIFFIFLIIFSIALLFLPLIIFLKNK